MQQRTPAQLRAFLEGEGVDFAACVAAFGQSAEENAYVRAAQGKAEEGELEIDETAVVSEGSDPGAYVLAWVWVSNTDAGVDSSALEALANVVGPTLSIDRPEDRHLLAAVDWLEETLSNFAEEIDTIHEEKVEDDAPVGVRWQTDFGCFEFVPSEVIEQMRVLAETRSLLDRATLHAVLAWLESYGDKLDRCIRAIRLGELAHA